SRPTPGWTRAGRGHGGRGPLPARGRARARDRTAPFRRRRAPALGHQGRHLARRRLRDAGRSVGPDRAGPPGRALTVADVRMAFEAQPEGDWYARAQAMCERALALDPDLPEARYVRARLVWSPP